MRRPDEMNVQRSVDIARQAVERCLALARLSEEDNRTTRTFLSPPMREVHRLVRGWMEGAGMTVAIDSIGNIRGSLQGTDPTAPRLIIGSHLDTVPGAGAFDGVLGVLLGLSLIENLDVNTSEFGIDLVGFSEEEGVRFGVPFLGSRAFIGGLDRSVLDRKDDRGITMAQVIGDFGLDPNLLDDAEYRSVAMGYVEFHIEQGPVLDSLNVPVGVVEAIVGQSRIKGTFRGQANHAGTTPMRLRRDALTAASEWIVEVEREAAATAGLVATVGSITALPGAANVIPGEVTTTLDVRHSEDSVRAVAVARMLDRAKAIAARRGVDWNWELRLDQSSVPCDRRLTEALARSVAMSGHVVHRMVSGAGHDAMIMASRMPVGMLFIRSPEGISHHSAETVRIEDVASALRVGWRFIEEATLHASTGTN